MLKTFTFTLLCASALAAQTTTPPAPVPALKPDAPLRLFLTGLNSSMAVKLDTRTGLVWQIKFDQTQTDNVVDASRWQKVINSTPLADALTLGRFTIQWESPLAPFTYGNKTVLLMLDQIDGRVWLLTLGKDNVYSFAPAPDPL